MNKRTNEQKRQAAGVRQAVDRVVETDKDTIIEALYSVERFMQEIDPEERAKYADYVGDMLKRAGTQELSRFIIMARRAAQLEQQAAKNQESSYKLMAKVEKMLEQAKRNVT